MSAVNVHICLCQRPTYHICITRVIPRSHVSELIFISGLSGWWWSYRQHLYVWHSRIFSSDLFSLVYSNKTKKCGFKRNHLVFFLKPNQIMSTVLSQHKIQKLNREKLIFQHKEMYIFNISVVCRNGHCQHIFWRLGSEMLHWLYTQDPALWFSHMIVIFYNFVVRYQPPK